MNNYYGILTNFVDLYKSAPKEVVADLDRLFPKEMNQLFNDLLEAEKEPREENLGLADVLIESEA